MAARSKLVPSPARASVPLLAALALGASAVQDAAPRRKVELNDAEALLERMEAKRFGSVDVKESAGGTLRLRGHLKMEIPGTNSEAPLESAVDICFDGERMSERMDYGSQGVSTQCFDGKLFWGIHPVFGTRIYRDKDERTLRRLFGIVRGAPWRTQYDAAEIVGEEKQEGATRKRLRLWAGDEYDTCVVDPATLLPIRFEIEMPECEPNTLAKLEYSDWRPVGGVLHPFVERFGMEGAFGVTTYDVIERGVELPAGRFDLPDEIRELAAKQAADPKLGDNLPSTQVVELEEQAAASIRVELLPAELNRTLALLLPEVMASLTEVGASTVGPPFARFHGEKDGVIDFEAGVPVAAPIAPRGRVKPSTLPGGRTVMIWYRGPYSGLAAARARLTAALVEKKLAPRGGMWIFYWTDPAIERDPARRRTQVLQPIE